MDLGEGERAVMGFRACCVYWYGLHGVKVGQCRVVVARAAALALVHALHAYS